MLDPTTPSTAFNGWTQLATDFKPILECAAIFVGSVALAKFFWERNNRATDVLIELEKQFADKVARGRFKLEDDGEYGKISSRLTEAASSPKLQGLKRVAEVDDLLRFYVVMYAIRRARQVPDRPLSICYRYWLSHFFRNDRVELRDYINELFPTLSAWLKADTSWQGRMWDRPFSSWWRPFFTPADFWKKSQIERDPRLLFPPKESA